MKMSSPISAAVYSEVTVQGTAGNGTEAQTSITAGTVNSDQNIDYLEGLKNLGIYRNETDDEYLNIRNAVVRFQALHNLTVDGIWGEQSQAALNKRVKDTNFSYPDAVSSPPSKGKWIVINKSLRILTLYENAAVVKKYPIAVGNPPSLTPEGKYTIVIKVVNPAWGGGGYAEPVEGGSPRNPLGYRWMGLSLNGGGDYGIHGNNMPYSIGTDASHGCIRMINSDVEELFDIMPASAPVWMASDQVLREWGVAQVDYSKEVRE